MSWFNEVVEDWDLAGQALQKNIDKTAAAVKTAEIALKDLANQDSAGEDLDLNEENAIEINAFGLINPKALGLSKEEIETLKQE